MFELNMDRDMACRTVERDLHAFASKKIYFNAKLFSLFTINIIFKFILYNQSHVLKY